MQWRNKIKYKYRPSHIANYFLWISWEDEIGITPMKLQKLIYMAYGWYIAIYNKKLFEEKIEAWSYAPIIPSIYHEFKEFGRNPIGEKRYAIDYNEETGEIISANMIDPEDEEVGKLLFTVWRIYKNYTYRELSKLIYKSESPWIKARARDDLYISDKDIKKHATELLKVCRYETK